MRRQAILSFTLLVCLSSLMGCGAMWGTLAQTTTVSQVQAPAYDYTGNTWSTQPSFNLQAPFGVTDSVALSAYSDAACKTTPAPGVLTVSQNPVTATSSGVAQFSGVSYTDASHLEETIYLKALGQTTGATICSSPIFIRQHFVTGVGAILGGTPGADGAVAAHVYDVAGGVVFDSEGRLLVALTSEDASLGRQVGLSRYFPDGTLDTSFGTSGHSFYPTSIAGASLSNQGDYIAWGLFSEGVKVDSQGRIVIAGTSVNSAGGYQLAVWRFTGSGAVDTSFGGGAGAVTYGNVGLGGATGSSEQDSASSVIIDPVGNIVVGGFTSDPAGANETAIWRYTSAGVLDTSFGGTGAVTYGPTGIGGATGSSEYDRISGIQVDSLNRYVVTGMTVTTTGTALFIARYNYNGTLDTSFNGTGVMHTASPGLAGGNSGGGTWKDEGGDIKIDAQGNYIIGGESENASGGTELAVWRFNSSGIPDTSFGGVGGVHWGSPGIFGTTGGSLADGALNVTLDGSGHYLVSSYGTDSSGGNQSYIVRYNLDGSKDTTFGTGGTVITGSPGLSGTLKAKLFFKPNFFMELGGTYRQYGYGLLNSFVVQSGFLIFSGGLGLEF